MFLYAGRDFLSKANAEPEYETIDEADLKEDDEVVEHIHERCQDRRKKRMKMVKKKL